MKSAKEVAAALPWGEQIPTSLEYKIRAATNNIVLDRLELLDELRRELGIMLEKQRIYESDVTDILSRFRRKILETT